MGRARYEPQLPLSEDERQGLTELLRLREAWLVQAEEEYTRQSLRSGALAAEIFECTRQIKLIAGMLSYAGSKADMEGQQVASAMQVCGQCGVGLSPYEDYGSGLCDVCQENAERAAELAKGPPQEDVPL